MSLITGGAFFTYKRKNIPGVNTTEDDGKLRVEISCNDDPLNVL